MVGLLYLITYINKLTVSASNLFYLFSVSFMMVDALEENVMKDILSMGLEQKKKHYQPSTKIPKDESVTDDACQRLTVTAKDKIQQHLAAGWWFHTLHNIEIIQTLPHNLR